MITVLIATCERKDLTGVCLDAVMACKQADTEVIIIDDCSSQYTPEWLEGFGVKVYRNHFREGAGVNAWLRLQRAVAMQRRFFILLDNDALVTPDFDIKSQEVYEGFRDVKKDMPLIFSPYRSATHESVSAEDELAEDEFVFMKDIGGISLAMDLFTAQHLLLKIPRWDNKWDYKVSEHATLICPAESWIEHMGRHAGGVNAPGQDRGLNFIGYRKHYVET